jgi:hypothetical protein
MRKLSATLTAAVFVAALSAPAFAKEMTVKGELVDQTCYNKDHKNVGAAHKDCAATCAKKGQQVALLTSDGKLYEVKGDLAANNNAKLVPHMSHTVEITGDVTTEGGQNVINATSVKMAKG